ncbi:MAG TPA: arsenite methyltransferase [Gemmatimonadales bacterium]|jgi:ubiquinone/menaquinone biosynthesis C-methylase UbiE|nr:arsenite methyltransferase [Gemmatimonadales bacterium]
MEPEQLKQAVQAKYGAMARQAADGGRTGCCGVACSCEADDPISCGLYGEGETNGLPDGAVLASLGCGNPSALADLRPGETVLDLGSGGGIDVLLSARRVGPGGKVYGLDMTDDMLALARANQATAGVSNAEFLKGDIEHIPLPNDSVDVVISNCVINLAGDKKAVLREAFRVLRPGGRFAVSDIVVRGDVPAAIRRSMELWVGCIAGALPAEEFVRLLSDAGFTEPSIEETRVYEFEDARVFLQAAGLDTDLVARDIAGRVVSAFVRATKPSACCGSTCCPPTTT